MPQLDRRSCSNAVCPQGNVPGMDGIDFCVYYQYRINPNTPGEADSARDTIGRNCPFAQQVERQPQGKPRRTT